MDYATDHVAQTLKSARVAKGLSQRALSARAGVPQSHISKIETGAVDLRVSSLIALARVLDLELTLVPRKTVPAVNSLIRNASRGASLSGPARKQLNQLQKSLDTLMETHPHAANLAQKPTARTLVTADRADHDLAKMLNLVRTLQSFEFSEEDLDDLKTVNRMLKDIKDNQKGRIALHLALTKIQRLRNRLAHSAGNRPDTSPALPAYSLEEDEDA